MTMTKWRSKILSDHYWLKVKSMIQQLGKTWQGQVTFSSNIMTKHVTPVKSCPNPLFFYEREIYFQVYKVFHPLASLNLSNIASQHSQVLPSVPARHPSKHKLVDHLYVIPPELLAMAGTGHGLSFLSTSTNATPIPQDGSSAFSRSYTSIKSQLKCYLFCEATFIL